MTFHILLFHLFVILFSSVLPSTPISYKPPLFVMVFHQNLIGIYLLPFAFRMPRTFTTSVDCHNKISASTSGPRAFLSSLLSSTLKSLFFPKFKRPNVIFSPMTQHPLVDQGLIVEAFTITLT